MSPVAHCDKTLQTQYKRKKKWRKVGIIASVLVTSAGIFYGTKGAIDLLNNTSQDNGSGAAKFLGGLGLVAVGGSALRHLIIHPPPRPTSNIAHCEQKK